MDLTGEKFGKLIVEAMHPEKTKHGNTRWICRCDCGNPKKLVVAAGNLRHGSVTSCGCIVIAALVARSKKHGMLGTPEYEAWNSIKKRCYNPKHFAYANYGGRGITMCDEWKNDFMVFYRDMGPRPSSNHSIDREKNELGYSKSNCRWATLEEQNNNRRNNVYITYEDRTQTLAMWCKELGLNRHLVGARIRKGWLFEEAIRPLKPLLITFSTSGDKKDEETHPLEWWCELLDLDKDKTYLRLLRGESFESIILE